MEAAVLFKALVELASALALEDTGMELAEEAGAVVSGTDVPITETLDNVDDPTSEEAVAADMLLERMLKADDPDVEGETKTEEELC